MNISRRGFNAGLAALFGSTLLPIKALDTIVPPFLPEEAGWWGLQSVSVNTYFNLEQVFDGRIKPYDDIEAEPEIEVTVRVLSGDKPNPTKEVNLEFKGKEKEFVQIKELTYTECETIRDGAYDPKKKTYYAACHMDIFHKGTENTASLEHVMKNVGNEEPLYDIILYITDHSSLCGVNDFDPYNRDLATHKVVMRNLKIVSADEWELEETYIHMSDYNNEQT